MSGFTDWAQAVADSEDAADFRSRVSDSENVSMWQSLAFNLRPYLDDRRGFLGTVVKPLQDKVETLYVRPGSPAKAYAERRFPHKPVKEVDGGYRAR